MSADILEAAMLNCHACDFCASVHVDFFDAEGIKFATAAVPRAHWEQFLARFRDCMAEVIARPHATPAGLQ